MVTKQTKGRFAIDITYSLCGNCGACVAVCPESVLHLGPVMLISNDDDCTGCQRCIILCPSDALKLRKASRLKKAALDVTENVGDSDV